MGAGGAAAATGRQRWPPGEASTARHRGRGAVRRAHRLLVGGNCPAGFPPWQTAYWYFVRWEEQRVTLRMLDALRQQVRQVQGRDPEASAGVLDSQSVKAADVIGRDTRGYDGGRRCLAVSASSSRTPWPAHHGDRVRGKCQNRYGVEGALLGLYLTSPTCRHVFADAVFAGRLLGWAADTLRTKGERRPQTRRPEGVRCAASQVGGRADSGLAHRAPPARPRRRTPHLHKARPCSAGLPSAS